MTGPSIATAPPIPSPAARTRAATLDQHVVEIISDSGEGAQRCGQALGAIAARMGNGVWTVTFISGLLAVHHRVEVALPRFGAACTLAAVANPDWRSGRRLVDRVSGAASEWHAKARQARGLRLCRTPQPWC